MIKLWVICSCGGLVLPMLLKSTEGERGREREGEEKERELHLSLLPPAMYAARTLPYVFAHCGLYGHMPV